ncbi:MAG: hypothetical protein K5695_09595 [Oscillospiraceae bacterium]|nr:hypothetical protein [Oscillospiraceae bacterium]
MALITQEELIRRCGLTKKECKGKDLDAFIRYFQFTEENVDMYNIQALLEDFSEPRDVQDVFTADAPKREDHFTTDVVYVAYRENQGTLNHSVYLDVAQQQKWAYENHDIFYDLNEYPAVKVSEKSISDFLTSFEQMGVFTMEDQQDPSASEISDPMFFVLVIGYADGTCFRVSRSGLPSKICPDYYDEMRKLLFAKK